VTDNQQLRHLFTSYFHLFDVSYPTHKVGNVLCFEISKHCTVPVPCTLVLRNNFHEIVPFLSQQTILSFNALTLLVWLCSL